MSKNKVVSYNKHYLFLLLRLRNSVRVSSLLDLADSASIDSSTYGNG